MSHPELNLPYFKESSSTDSKKTRYLNYKANFPVSSFAIDTNINDNNNNNINIINQSRNEITCDNIGNTHLNNGNINTTENLFNENNIKISSNITSSDSHKNSNLNRNNLFFNQVVTNFSHDDKTQGEYNLLIDSSNEKNSSKFGSSKLKDTFNIDSNLKNENYNSYTSNNKNAYVSSFNNYQNSNLNTLKDTWYTENVVSTINTNNENAINNYNEDYIGNLINTVNTNNQKMIMTNKFVLINKNYSNRKEETDDTGLINIKPFIDPYNTNNIIDKNKNQSNPFQDSYSISILPTYNFDIRVVLEEYKLNYKNVAHKIDFGDKPSEVFRSLLENTDNQDNIISNDNKKRKTKKNSYKKRLNKKEIENTGKANNNSNDNTNNIDNNSSNRNDQYNNLINDNLIYDTNKLLEYNEILTQIPIFEKKIKFKRQHKNNMKLYFCEFCGESFPTGQLKGSHYSHKHSGMSDKYKEKMSKREKRRLLRYNSKLKINFLKNKKIKFKNKNQMYHYAHKLKDEELINEINKD